MPLSHRVLAVVALVLLACAARKPGDPIKPGYNSYSPQQDIEIGKQVVAEIRKQVDIVDDAALQNYISELGAKLASQPEAGGYPYSFTLINDPSINAFALPGGPIFVNSGLLAKAENEAQVAGVLAHEISHVVLRHGTNQASKAALMQIPAVLAGVALSDNAAAAQLGQIGVGLGLNLLMMKYSRTAEKQSDALGARILSGAGYNPVEMARFFEQLEGEGGEHPPAILSTHPNPGNRVKLVEAEMTALPQRPYTAGTNQFAQMQGRVAKLPEPKPPVHTAAQATAPPSAPRQGVKEWNDGRIRFAYPADWEVFGSRESSVITLAPRRGLVQTQSGGTAIGYGAVLSMYRPQTPRATLNSATGELIGQLEAVNRGLRATGQQQGQISNNAALLTHLVSSSPYGGTEMNYLLTVAQPDGLFYLVFVVPERDARQLQNTFEMMINSIQFAR